MISRRKFISSIAAAGLLSAMPSPIKAWADDLCLPKGARLVGPDGVLIATSKVDQWENDIIKIESFDWVVKPQKHDPIPAKFIWAAINARAKLGFDATENDFFIASSLVNNGYPNPLLTKRNNMT